MIEIDDCDPGSEPSGRDCVVCEAGSASADGVRARRADSGALGAHDDLSPSLERMRSLGAWTARRARTQTSRAC